MKIDSSVKSLGGLAGGSRKESAKSAGTPAQPAGGQSTEVELSPLSARLQELESAMASSPVADSDRIDAIRAAISAGTFKIDASKIADGLVNSVRQMLAAQK